MVPHSLRWRLPALICALFFVALMAVVYAAYREVEATLVRASADRAKHAAEQVASLFEQLTQPSLDQLRRVAAAPALARYLQDPTPQTRAAAQDALAALVSRTAARRVTLWTAAGARLFELPEPLSEAAALLPKATRRVDVGIDVMQQTAGRVFTDAAAAINDNTSPAGRAIPLGYLSVRSFLTITPVDLLSRLVGSDARVEIGNRAGGVWTDFTRVVPAPAINLTADGVGEFRTAEGERRLGFVKGVRGTPWAVWVDLSRAAIVAPAWTFLRRLSALGIMVALVTALLVRAFTTHITTPLAEMTAVAEAMAGGDYSPGISTDRRDEIGRLGRAFNTMNAQVAGAHRRLEQRVQERTRELDDALAALSKRSQERETYLATLVDSSDDAIIGTNMDGGVQSWNNGAQLLYGYAPSEMIGQPIDRIVPPDRPMEWTDLLDRLSRGEHIRPVETLRSRKDGSTVAVALTVSPIHDASGQVVGASAVARDMTERKALEDQLRHAQKMEAIGQLAGGVAHDFNNALTAILGFSDLQIGEMSEDNPVRADLIEIRKAGQQAAGLTRQLLAFSRKQILAPKVLDVNALIAGMEPMLRRVIVENVNLAVTLTPRVGLIKMDPTQLEQILINLAINAADAMPRGGRLTIETANVTLDEHYQQRHLPVAPGKYVMLAVSDTGAGMDEATSQRIFEPFFTTKEIGKGTGLGLATVYGIVKQSDGDIWVYSQPGMGTTFKIYLPQVAAAAPGFVPATLETSGTRGSETVLLVEDDHAVRRFARIALERDGYHVHEASNPREAVEVAAAIEGRIHLLVSDVVMPESEGAPLIERLQPKHPGLRVLYMSGYTDESIVRHGILIEGTAFLQKPFTPRALTQKVRDVLDAARPVAITS